MLKTYIVVDGCAVDAHRSPVLLIYDVGLLTCPVGKGLGRSHGRWAIRLKSPPHD
jgi:hypothetical protein